MSAAVQLACKLELLLGEGPIWKPDEQTLWFVDIKRGQLQCFDPAAGHCETHDVGGEPSFVVPLEGGGLLVGSRRQLFRFDGMSLGSPLFDIDMPEHNRTNDATVDGGGRLWFGTMDDEERLPSGALHCLDRGILSTSTWQAVVTNGPAVSLDGRWLYHVDSGERTIWRLAVDGGNVGAGEVFVQLSDTEGYPDGVVIDSENCLWVALWDGWAIRRYAPDGTLLLEVATPCARPTKIAFGGPDLRTAYVTTARIGLTASALAEQPLAGSILSFAAPAAGRILPSVRLS